jgi:hypothetical protein
MWVEYLNCRTGDDGTRRQFGLDAGHLGVDN